MKKLLNKAKGISYSKFRKLGYTGNFVNFSYEINKLILMSKELDASSLDIASGKSCQQSKFLSGSLGVLTALTANGFNTAMANNLLDPNGISNLKKTELLNKVDRDTFIALSIFVSIGFIIGGSGTAAVITKFKDEPAVSLFNKDLKNFNTIDCLRSKEISTETLPEEIKKDVFLEFVQKFMEYSEITLQNVTIDQLFSECATYELNIDKIETDYNYINGKLLKFTKKDINKNAFWGCYNLYVSAYQNQIKEKELITVQKKLDQKQKEKQELQTNCNQLTNELQTQIQNNNDLQKNVDELNQEQQQLKTKNEILEEQILSLQNEKDELQNINENLKQSTTEKQSMVEQNKMDEQNEEQNAAPATDLFSKYLKNDFVKEGRQPRIKKALTVLVQNYIQMLRAEKNLLDDCRNVIDEHSAAQDDEKKNLRETIGGIGEALDMLNLAAESYTKYLEIHRIKETQKNDLTDNKPSRLSDYPYDILQMKLHQYMTLLNDLLYPSTQGIRDSWRTTSDSPIDYLQMVTNMFERITNIINIDCSPSDSLLAPEQQLFLLRVVKRTIQHSIPISIQNRILDILNPEKDKENTTNSGYETTKEKFDKLDAQTLAKCLVEEFQNGYLSRSSKTSK